MPTWLIDPPFIVYLVLGTVAIIFGALWLREPSRGNLVRFAVGAGLLVLVGLIDLLVESPREAAVRKIKAMAAASQSKKSSEFGQYVSDSFRYHNLDKGGLISRVVSAEGQPDFQGVIVSDFDRQYVKMLDENRVQVGFVVKPIGYPILGYFVLADFRKDPDGEWRLATFELYDKSAKDLQTPVNAPGLD